MVLLLASNIWNIKHKWSQIMFIYSEFVNLMDTIKLPYFASLIRFNWRILGPPIWGLTLKALGFGCYGFGPGVCAPNTSCWTLGYQNPKKAPNVHRMNVIRRIEPRWMAFEKQGQWTTLKERIVYLQSGNSQDIMFGGLMNRLHHNCVWHLSQKKCPINVPKKCQIFQQFQSCLK